MSATRLRRGALIVLMLGTFARLAAVEPAKPRTDLEKLQGTWAFLSEERGGQKVAHSDEEIKGMKLVIKDDKITLTHGQQTEEVTFKIDETKSPKQIDVTETKDGKSVVHLGIYKLEKDTFTLCASHSPDPRPTEFATQAGAQWPALFVLKKEQKSDEELLVGTWTGESGELGGEKVPEEKIQAFALTFAAEGKLTLKTPKEPGKEGQGTFTLDSTKNPRHIDLMVEQEEVRGIYKIEGDTLTLCMVRKQEERPTEFFSQVGTKQALIVLKREKK